MSPLTIALILAIYGLYLIARGLDAKRREDRLADRILVGVRAEFAADRGQRLDAGVVAMDSLGKEADR